MLKLLVDNDNTAIVISIAVRSRSSNAVVRRHTFVKPPNSSLFVDGSSMESAGVAVTDLFFPRRQHVACFDEGFSLDRVLDCARDGEEAFFDGIAFTTTDALVRFARCVSVDVGADSSCSVRTPISVDETTLTP